MSFSFKKNNRPKYNPGVLLIEIMIYVLLSTLTITLLFQLALKIYTQSKLACTQQAARNNLWVATDLLKRDLQKLTTLAQLSSTNWVMRNNCLYRKTAVRQICMLEQVHKFEITPLAPNLIKIIVSATCGAKLEQIERWVYLRNF